MAKFTATFSVILTAIVLWGCGSPRHDSAAGEPVVEQGVVWGTTYRVVVCPGNDAITPDHVREGIGSALDAISAVANAFDTTSVICALNRGETITRSCYPESFDDFRRVTELAIHWSGATGGAFDPTVGPLVSLWGFGSAGKPSVSPEPGDVSHAMQHVGVDHIHLCGVDSVFAAPGTQLDFAGIAKGLGVDYVMNAIGAQDCMVEIGGEVSARGHNPQRNPWRIQIDRPVPDQNGTHQRLAVVELRDAAMATSGNYRNFYTDSITGKTVAHTISPFDGYPRQTDLLSVTVFAASCADADAVATALMVMGSDAAVRWVEKNSGSLYGAILVTDNGAGGYDIRPVSLSPDHVEIIETKQ